MRPTAKPSRRSRSRGRIPATAICCWAAESRPRQAPGRSASATTISSPITDPANSPAFLRLWDVSERGSAVRLADACKNILRMVGELREGIGHLFARFADPFDKLVGEGLQLRRGGDEPRLTFDALGIEIIFGARNAPAAPFRLPRHNDGIGAGHGMA